MNIKDRPLLQSRSPEGAQSEVLGIVLLLGLTMVAIGGILYFAEPAISGGMELSESSQIENEFSLLDSKLATSALGASEAQKVEMNLHGGELEADPYAAKMTIYHNFTDDHVKLTADAIGKEQLTEGVEKLGGSCGGGVTCDPVNQTSHIDDAQAVLNRTLVEIDMGNLEYTDMDNNEKIAYEGGAVWKKSLLSNESVMISPPEFHYSPRGQTLTIPIFNITDDFTVSSTAGRDIRVGTTPEARQLFDENPIVGGAVKAEVQSEYYRAWANYFDTRTAGAVGEDNIDDDEQTAVVDLEVPHDDDIDGGHAFQGNGESGYFEGDPGENEFFLSASPYIESMISEGNSDNHNNRADCIDNNQLEDEDCELDTPDDEDALYYVDNENHNSQNFEFDISEGNITLVIDAEIDIRGNSDWEITDNSSDTRVEVMTATDLDVGGNGNINGAGNTSEMVFFVHSDVDEVDIDGSSADNFDFTLYAPNSYLTVGGLGNIDWSGAIIAAGTTGMSGPENNQIEQGSAVDLNLGAQSDTITYLQVTENEVRVE